MSAPPSLAAQLQAAAEAVRTAEHDAAAARALGRALLHCAQSIDFSRTGFPQSKPRLLQATVGRLVLRKFLRDGRMSHDTDAPVPGAPALPEIAAADALARLTDAVAAFEAEGAPLAPHFFYGPVTRAEYVQLHAMHIADHLKAFARA